MESSKTEVLSFDDALNNHKKALTESLVNFDEGHRVRKILLDVDSNSADYEYYFQSGQQSKQAEVEELQKKIDLALEKCYTGIRKQGGDYYLELIKNVLKGEHTK